MDDAFLLRFLRARKFDYDRALELLLNYHAGRRAWPEVFQDLKPSTVKHVLDLGFLSVLPHPDPSGRYILCLQPGRGVHQGAFTAGDQGRSLGAFTGGVHQGCSLGAFTSGVHLGRSLGGVHQVVFTSAGHQGRSLGAFTRGVH